MFCRTFDRIIDGSRNVFVRFDKEYAYGEAHDAWKEYAKTVGESAADLLSADVGVSGAPLADRARARATTNAQEADTQADTHAKAHTLTR
eukprot:4990410-Pleurochrysis_carterae.AAC.1